MNSSDLPFRKFLPFLITAVFVALSACSGNNKPAVKDADPKPLSGIPEDQIFSGDIVKRFAAASDEALGEAKKLFLNAVNVYRNENNPQGSIPLFIQSICKSPDSQTYYEMGNACMDAGDLDRSVQCYEMAEKLGYEPFSKVLYNLACAYSKKKEFEKSAEYLEYSLQAGYSNIDQIAKDPDLESLREEAPEWRYTEALKKGMSGMSDPDKLFWLQFKKGFAKVRPDFFLNGEKRQFTEEDYVSFDYEKYISELRTERFAREVGRSFYYVAEIAAGNNITALVYAEEDPYEEESPIIYRLSTFTNDGQLIDKRIIAGMENYEVLQTAKFSGRTITVKSFDVIYTKDVKGNGIKNNPVKSRNLSGESTFEITPEGKITEIIAA